jgi:single-stranded-DNA-specific exonuclease
VIGLAAARLVEKHYRPSIVVSVSNGEARGSCRSVHGYHITRALDSCADVLQKHGGHAAAAGFTMRSELLEQLCERLNDHAANAQPEGGWRRRLDIDAVVPLEALDWKAHQELQLLGPHGIDNPRPLFAARNVRVHSAARMGRAEGAAGAHLKLFVKDARGAGWDCVAWRMGDRIDETPPGALLDLAFQLDVNEWNGSRKLQLVLQDFRPAAGAI